MVKAKTSGSLLNDFVQDYRGKLKFSTRIWTRLLLVTLALVLSAALISAVSLWSDTFVAAGFYSDVCDESKDHRRLNETAVSSQNSSDSCLKQYVGVVTSVIGGNVYGVQCASFFTEFFNRHGGYGCVVAGSCFLVLGWIGILSLQQASQSPQLQFLTHNYLQLCSMSASIGTNLLCEATYSFMTPTNGLQGLLLVLSSGGVGGGALETFGLKYFAYKLGWGPQGMIVSQVFLAVTSVILCLYCVPSEAELRTYSSHAKEPEQKQEEDRLTISEVRQLCQGASRMIWLNWFRHTFFLCNMAVNTACAAMYQGLATKYGTLLFGTHTDGIILACISSGSAMIVVSGLAPCVNILMEHIGLRKLFISMTVLLWISRICVDLASWFAQVFVAVTFALIWGLQPVVWGTHAYAYAMLNRVATVILIFGVLYVFFFEMAQAYMFLEFQAYENTDDLQSLQVLLRAGIRNCTIISSIYTVFFCISGLPKSPVIFPDEESDFCKLFACSKLEQVTSILNLKDTKSCYDLISQTSVPENHPLLVSRINEESLKYALSCKSASQIAGLIEEKSFAWQKQFKNRSRGPIIGLIAPASQWREIISDVDLGKLGEGSSKALTALQREIEGGLSKMVVDAHNPDKVVRYVDVVVLRVHFGHVGAAGNYRDLLLIETGRPSHAGSVTETFRFPGTKKQKGESVQEAAGRLLSWLGVEDLQLHIEFLKSEVALESQESVNYPGLTTVYKKHFGDITILDDCNGMRRIGLPGGLAWHRGGNPKDHHFAWYTVEDILELHPDFIASSNGSKGSRDGVERITGVLNINLKDLSPEERGRKLNARKHTSALATLIRKREKVALKAELETGNIEHLKEGFGGMPLWLGLQALPLYHKRFLELFSWTELASTLRTRRQLRPVVTEIVLHDLMSAKLALKDKMAGFERQVS